MGLRGPAPTPTRILETRGSWRAKINDGELRFPEGEPNCPAFLSREAKAEWRRQVELLRAAGILTEADRAALAVYCEAWGEFAELCTRLKASPSDWRLRMQKNAAADRAIKAAAQFGFSPSARARLKGPGDAVEGQGGEGKARFFAG